jgi:hypothetical protein
VRELSDLQLLQDALALAMAAQRAGVLGGPGVDEVALRAAERRARRRDRARLAVSGVVVVPVARVLAGVAA